MKVMMSVLSVAIMALVLVSVGQARAGSSYNGNLAVLAPVHNVSANVGDRDTAGAGNLTALPPYLCIAAPAYTGYVDARAIPCPLNENLRRVPEPMGSWE